MSAGDSPSIQPMHCDYVTGWCLALEAAVIPWALALVNPRRYHRSRCHQGLR
jgi:hypothetical protein